MDAGRGVGYLDAVVKYGRIASEGEEGAGPDDPRTQVDVEEQAVQSCPWIKRVCVSRPSKPVVLSASRS